MEKSIMRIVAGAVVVFGMGIGTGAVAFRPHTGTDGGTGNQLEAARELNLEIGREQQRSLERVERSVDALERIRRITTEADSVIRELGESNRRSGDILTQLAEEINILENYFRDISGIVGGYDNYAGGE